MNFVDVVYRVAWQAFSRPSFEYELYLHFKYAFRKIIFEKMSALCHFEVA